VSAGFVDARGSRIVIDQILVAEGARAENALGSRSAQKVCVYVDGVGHAKIVECPGQPLRRAGSDRSAAKSRTAPHI